MMIQKKVLHTFVYMLLGIIELAEWIDDKLFMEDDTWQMRVMYYGMLVWMISVGCWATTLF